MTNAKKNTMKEQASKAMQNTEKQIKKRYFDFETMTFNTDVMAPRTLKTYMNHLEKMDYIESMIIDLHNMVPGTAEYLQQEVKILKNLHWTHHRNTKKRHSKLDGIVSVSTSAIFNKSCLQRKNCSSDCICAHCYAINQQLCQIGVFLCMIRNQKILESAVYSVEAWQSVELDEDTIRFNSFGEANSTIEAHNYINCALAHPDKTCGVWTKMWRYYIEIFETIGKPDNLSFGISSLMINKPDFIPARCKPWVDFIFTVYTPNFAEENGIEINCGGRHCKSCMACYHKNGTMKVINEQLK